MVATDSSGVVNIVKDYKIKNTRIKFSDDFCKSKTQEDVEKILQRIARNSIENLNMVATNECCG